MILRVVAIAQERTQVHSRGDNIDNSSPVFTGMFKNGALLDKFADPFTSVHASTLCLCLRCIKKN